MGSCFLQENWSYIFSFLQVATFVEHTGKGNQVEKQVPDSENSKRGNEEEWKISKEVRNRDGESSQDLQQYDETSNLYLM